MLTKIFGTVFEFPKKQLFNCSVQGCMKTTNGQPQANFRNRWMLGVTIGDEEESEVVNLCPDHVREFFGLTETDYKAMELGEGIASNKLSVKEWKNAISGLR